LYILDNYSHRWNCVSFVSVRPPFLGGIKTMIGRIERTLANRFKNSKIGIIGTFEIREIYLFKVSFKVDNNDSGYAELINENTLFIQFETYSGINKLEG